MQGFLNLNKPAGWTSHDCVARVRRLLKLKRVGHAGTLDPAAVGVLPLAVGKATRLLQFLPAQKAYRATIRFGMTTTTDDLEGETLTTQNVAELNLEQIRTILPKFLGKIEQIPPRYSAIQVDGKRLYDLARQGKAVEVPKRTVEVFQLDVLGWNCGEFPELQLAITCGAGTYIRSIARDLGEMLHTGGTLAHLVRTHSSGFDLTESLTIEVLESQIKQGTFQLIPPSTALKHLEAITLSSVEDAKRWCQGQAVVCQAENTTNSIFRVYHPEGLFLGLGQTVLLDSQTVLKPQIVLADQSQVFLNPGKAN
ncbi:tRNA pseudouridine(55) synthase TruB [Capilliphycus salinus ALCB114379]|uniref:tRNA pseudouridine(55) synthase TruB n=1 Tax=Capilliphycus salinus TaxID=2768948 RepID=UPI0039A7596C